MPKEWRTITQLLDMEIKCCLTCMSFKVDKDDGFCSGNWGSCRDRKAKGYGVRHNIKEMLERKYLRGTNCKNWKGDK